MTIPLYNMEGKEIEQIKLDKEIFDGSVNKAVLREVILAHLAAHRRGTASTKTKAEVRGGGRKPWRQKGTGRARAGSIRSPIWRGGGITFGPKPRDFRMKIPRKVKRLALCSCINDKLKEKSIMVVEELKLDKAKTKSLVKILTQLKLISASRKKKEKLSILLLVGKKKNLTLLRAAGNLAGLVLKEANSFSTYDAFTHRQLLFTKDAWSAFVERIKK